MLKIIKIFFRFFLVIVIVLTMLFAASYFFIKVNGRTILTKKLSLALGKHVEIGAVRVTYPLGLWLKDLKVQGYGSISGVRIGFGVVHLFDKHFDFPAVVLEGPEIICHKTKESVIIWGDLPVSAQVPDEGPQGQGGTTEGSGQKPLREISTAPLEKRAISIYIDHLIIQNGSVTFLDYGTEGEALEVVFRNVQLKARNVSYPFRSIRTKFDFSAFVGGSKEQFQSGAVEGRGWVDFVGKNMKAQLKISNFDGQYFAQYFDKSRRSKYAKKIVADLSADLESKNNDMVVRGKIQIKGIIPRKESDRESRTFSAEDFILGSLQSLAKEIALDFQFKTKMDHFKLESISFSGNVFGGSLTQGQNADKSSQSVESAESVMSAKPTPE